MLASLLGAFKGMRLTIWRFPCTGLPKINPNIAMYSIVLLVGTFKKGP